MAFTVNTGKQVKSKDVVMEIFKKTISLSSKKEDNSPKSGREYEYDFSNEFRGLAVIISNGTFKEHQPRPYCDDELKLMSEIFGNSGLKFTVVAFKDLTEKQMIWVLEVASEQNKFHKKSDCFVCVIASHGNEKPRPLKNKEKSTVYFRDHIVYGSDGETITTKSVIERFCQVEELENKPKLFFIQACRTKVDSRPIVDLGYKTNLITLSQENLNCRDETSEISVHPTKSDQRQDNVDLHDDATEGFFKNKSDRSNSKAVEIIRIIDPPCDDDCLVVYSSSSEKESYGRKKQGGWMLNSLHKVVQEQLELMTTKHDHRIDLLSVLISVAWTVSACFETNFGAGTENPKRKSAIVLEHCLHKEIYID